VAIERPSLRTCFDWSLADRLSFVVLGPAPSDKARIKQKAIAECSHLSGCSLKRSPNALGLR
jgi:hypothetical protein